AGAGDGDTELVFCRADDGIRDRNVTGVQTCALPIFIAIEDERAVTDGHLELLDLVDPSGAGDVLRCHDEDVSDRLDAHERLQRRSEERRVGGERASRGAGKTGQRGWPEGRPVRESSG